MTDPDTILLEAEESMDKALDYLQHELRGIRTGRASTALVEYLKVEYFGTPTDLKSLAAINVPEPSQIVIKPYDAGSINEIKKAIETSGLDLTPMIEKKPGSAVIRLSIPALSGERRTQLVGRVKKMGEEAKVVLRNTRRDANKHADGLAKQEGKHYPEDEISTLKDEIQDLLKKYEKQVDERVAAKSQEVLEV
jgi:ribosome recycling factor